MEKLSRFLAEQIVDKDDFSIGGVCEGQHHKDYIKMIDHFADLVSKIIGKYRKQLAADATANYSVAIRELQLAQALEDIEAFGDEKPKDLTLRCRNCALRYTTCIVHKITAACSCNEYVERRKSICPLNKYFESDADIVDVSRCDLNNSPEYNANSPGCIRCTQACFLKLKDEHKS